MPGKIPEVQKKKVVITIAAQVTVTARAKKEKKKEGAVIRNCACGSPFQDKLYGAGRRVFCIGKDGPSCTICGRKQ